MVHTVSGETWAVDGCIVHTVSAETMEDVESGENGSATWER